MVGNLGFIRRHSSVLDEVWSDASCPSQSPAEAGHRMMGIMQHWQAEDDKPDNRRHKCQTALAYYEQMWLLRKYTWCAVVMETRSLTHTSRARINVYVWKHCENPGKASTAVFIDNWKSPDGYSLCCHAESLIFEARSEFRVCVWLAEQMTFHTWVPLTGTFTCAWRPLMCITLISLSKPFQKPFKTTELLISFILARSPPDTFYHHHILAVILSETFLLIRHVCCNYQICRQKAYFTIEG